MSHRRKLCARAAAHPDYCHSDSRRERQPAGAFSTKDWHQDERHGADREPDHPPGRPGRHGAERRADYQTDNGRGFVAAMIGEREVDRVVAGVRGGDDVTDGAANDCRNEATNTA